LKQELEPIVIDEIVNIDNEKGMVYTGSGVEKVTAIEVEYYNKDNDRSVYNMVSPRIQEKLKRLSVQELLLTDEWELKEIIKPTPTLNRLRISFWREFDRAQTKNTDMKMVKVYAGICPKEQFERYLDNDNHTVWILKPPVDYVNAMEEALMFGIDRLREILEIPLVQTRHIKLRDADGADYLDTYEEFDPKTAELLIKTVAMLDMRVKGALVQKVEQKVIAENRNVNANLTATVSVEKKETVEEAALQIGVEDLDGEIKRLEETIKKDVKKVEKPFNNSELKRISKEGIKIEELAGVDLGKIKSLQSKEVQNKVGARPPKVIEVEERNAVEIEDVDTVLGGEEEEEVIDLDLDLGDL